MTRSISVWMVALATLALSIALITGPTYAQVGDSQQLTQLRAMLDQRKADVLRLCPLAPRPTPLTGATIHEGSIVDLATSPAGQVAMAAFDQDDNRVLVFPRGLSEGSVAIGIPGAFEAESLKISNDGRFVAWAAGAPPVLTVYDVAEGTAQRLPQITNPCAVQWIGEQLLVRNCPGQVVTLARGEGGFTPVQTVDDDARVSPRISQREAISDQLGESFMRGPDVYPSRAAAEAAGSIVVSSIGSARAPLRVGRDLFVLSNRTSGPATAQENEWISLAPNGPTPRLVRVSDGKELDLRDRACLPDSMAAPPGGSTFAILQGGALIQILDPQTLTVIGTYTLESPWNVPPTKIAYVSKNTILVMTSGSVARYELPPPRR